MFQQGSSAIAVQASRDVDWHHRHCILNSKHVGHTHAATLCIFKKMKNVEKRGKTCHCMLNLMKKRGKT